MKNLNTREFATVLAGLRLLQATATPPEAIQQIASNIGAVTPLNADEIDELCGWLNSQECDPTPTAEAPAAEPEVRLDTPARFTVQIECRETRRETITVKAHSTEEAREIADEKAVDLDFSDERDFSIEYVITSVALKPAAPVAN